MYQEIKWTYFFLEWRGKTINLLWEIKSIMSFCEWLWANFCRPISTDDSFSSVIESVTVFFFSSALQSEGVFEILAVASRFSASVTGSLLRFCVFHSKSTHLTVRFFLHKYTRNTMNIACAKIKKKSRSRFFKPQPARASLMFTVPRENVLVCWLFKH